MVEGRKFPIGLSTFDIMKKALLLSLIFISVMVLVCFFMVVVAIALADDFACLIILFAGVLLFASVFALGIFVLTIPLRGFIIKKAKNEVEVMNDEIRVLNTWDMALPPVLNTIPIDNIRKIESAGEDYFRERWKKTGWFHRMNLLAPRPPHGGLYYSMTSRDNLLIIYLFEPIQISNTNFLPSRRPPLMKVTEEWVREVIVDVHPDLQDEFIDLVYRKINLMSRSGK